MSTRNEIAWRLGRWVNGYMELGVGVRSDISRPRLRAVPLLLPLVINSVKPRTRPRRKDVVAEWRVCLHQPFSPHTHPSIRLFNPTQANPTIRKPNLLSCPWALSLALLVRRYPFLIRFTQHFLPLLLRFSLFVCQPHSPRFHCRYVVFIMRDLREIELATTLSSSINQR